MHHSKGIWEEKRSYKTLIGKHRELRKSTRSSDNIKMFPEMYRDSTDCIHLALDMIQDLVKTVMNLRPSLTVWLIF